jgi:hypothetical protein
MKTNELIGPALDWAVAKCEGYEVDVATGTGLVIIRRENVVDYFDPSTNWGWGGPIIEREEIGIDTRPSIRQGREAWVAVMDNDGQDMHEYDGPTPLIAAMRCLVASKLGDEVEIPEELI